MEFLFLGIEAVQQPCRERYPINDGGDVPGIDAWLTAYSSGLQVGTSTYNCAMCWVL